MQEYNSINNSSSLSLINAILRKWVLILLVTILGALLGMAYSMSYVKPTYTASRSVILRLSVGDLQANTVTTNVTLSKIYLPDVIEFVGSPAVINKANELFGGEKQISSGAIGVGYSNKEIDSLIFSISYTDASVELAEQKLTTIIESVMIVDNEMDVIEAEDFSLIPTQNESKFTMNNAFANYIIIGGAAGLVISMLIVIVMHLLDNTVIDKNEFEELTGIDVLSNIKKQKDFK
jgi:capsular polysaccharide biosynthesis protein